MRLFPREILFFLCLAVSPNVSANGGGDSSTSDQPDLAHDLAESIGGNSSAGAEHTLGEQPSPDIVDPSVSNGPSAFGNEVHIYDGPRSDRGGNRQGNQDATNQNSSHGQGQDSSNDTEYQLDSTTIKFVLTGSRDPATVGRTVPSYPPTVMNSSPAATNYGALLNFALSLLELNALSREQRKMGAALSNYASTIPTGEKVEVRAWFKNRQFTHVSPKDEPQLLDGSALNESLPFEIYGTAPSELTIPIP